MRITTIPKSKSDKRDYLVKQLSNGLKVIIVSDIEADTSAASLSVNIGNLLDPIEYQGLAHFCEHMLFMGTEKYPDEAKYDKFINENGGSSNAYTMDDITNYHFEISNEAFPKALDMFSNFFIKPLFNPESVRREIKAVDSEFNQKILNDKIRLYQLLKSQANPKSLFTKFNLGNLESLSKPNIREELCKFYEQYYTSDIMALSIVSNKSIIELEETIDNLFNQIPQKKSFIKPKYDEVLPYDSSNIGYMFKITPIKKQDKLFFVWVLPDDLKHYRKNPLSIISSLIGHEGPNTLTSSLIKDDLISSLCSSAYSQADTFCEFMIEVTLTKKGLSSYIEVISRVLKYIKVIQKEEVNDRFCNEEIKIDQLKFDYEEKIDNMNYCCCLSENLLKYKPEDVLTAKKIIFEYDRDLIKQYLDLLSIDTVNILFSSQTLESQCNLKEKWFGTMYDKSKLDLKESDIMQSQCKHVLSYPPINIFIPESLELLPMEPEKENDFPEKLLKDDLCTIWYKKDNHYKLPIAEIKGVIYLKNSIMNHSYLFNQTIVDIWQILLTNELREISYMAEQANIVFSFTCRPNVIIISLSGFSQVMPNAIKEIIKAFKAIDYSDKEESFKLQIEKRMQDYMNFYCSTNYVVAYKYLSMFMTVPSSIPLENIDILQKGISLDDLIQYLKEVMNKVRYEWLIQGNITKEEAKAIAKTFEAEFPSKKLGFNDFEIFRSVNINSKTNYLYCLDNTNKNEINSTIASLFQCGNLSLKEECCLSIIESMLKQKFYDDLRTKQALGYSVLLFQYYNYQNEGLTCIVLSSVQAPEYIWGKINEFFKVQNDYILNVSKEEFQTHVNSVIVEKKKKHLSLIDEVSENYSEIYTHLFIFDRKKQQCELLEKMQIEDVVNFYKEHFIDDIRRLDIEYVAECHREINEELIKKNNCANLDIKRIQVRSKEEFSMKNNLYPCYNTINMDL